MKKNVKEDKIKRFTLSRETVALLRTQTHLRAGEPTTGPSAPSFTCSACSQGCA